MDWYSMVWRKYAEFDGRSRRSEYWMFNLFNILAIFALAALGGVGIAASPDYGGVLFVPLGVYALAAVIPSLAVSVRRLHDSGKSGWLLLLFVVLGLIPIVGFITAVIQIVIMCQDSDPGPNQYGPNPKFPEQAAGIYAGVAGFTPMVPVAPLQQITGENRFGLCKSCGASLTGGSSFCTRCGTHV